MIPCRLVSPANPYNKAQPNKNKQKQPLIQNINPIAQSMGVSNLKDPPNIVAIQLNIFIPVGTAIIIVAAVKYALVSTSIPTVNI